MKWIKYILASLVVSFLAVSCYEGIDPISKVDPGPDASAPVITIKYPNSGTQIRVPEAVVPITVDVEVTDDIELGSISLQMDGVEFAKYSQFGEGTDFRDYRRALIQKTYDNLTNGPHVFKVVATDLEGKSTTREVTFEKISPYTPVFAGEIFYMPFDGDYMELISLKEATKVGSPGFAGTGVKNGSNSYAGATDSYLTFPTQGLQGNEFSASFWLKVNAVPDRAGILVMGPIDPAAPTAMNNRKNGFRFFRENAGGKQRFKLNVGNGTADSWFDGGAAADVDPTKNEWVHFAFTIAPAQCVVYINGKVVSQGNFTGVNWDGTDIMSIMSGAPRFTGWDHKSDRSFMDELRLFNRALTQADIQAIMTHDSGVAPPYQPKYNGEVFYMPFEDHFKDLVSNTNATVTGNPTYADGKVGKAYKGAPDSYLTFPATALQSSNFSAVFWMKVNATPDRAGVLVMGPPDPDKPDAMNNRTSGFRFFRENAGGKQRFKLNAGFGTGDTWFDGGAAADVDPATGNWVHYAFTISGTEGVVYIDGEVVKQGDFGGISWTGCDILTIMSGVPRFTEWNHKSDESLMDELRIFNKALSQQEIQTIINAEK